MIFQLVFKKVQEFTELQVLTKTGKITESNKGKITESNKRKKYVAYLQLMEDLSSKNRYKADQLEFFLFSMGKNLKPTKN